MYNVFCSEVEGGATRIATAAKGVRDAARKAMYLYSSNITIVVNLLIYMLIKYSRQNEA